MIAESQRVFTDGAEDTTRGGKEDQTSGFLAGFAGSIVTDVCRDRTRMEYKMGTLCQRRRIGPEN